MTLLPPAQFLRSMIQENFSPSESFSHDIFLVKFSVLNEESQNPNLQSKVFRSSFSYSVYEAFNDNRVSNTVSGTKLNALTCELT